MLPSLEEWSHYQRVQKIESGVNEINDGNQSKKKDTISAATNDDVLLCVIRMW